MAEEQFFEMTIDGKKTKVSEKVISSRSMREKKVEVLINGKIIRVSEHMLNDIAKFKGMPVQKTIKNPPAELLQMPKKLILPTVIREIKAKVEEPVKVEQEAIPPANVYPSDTPVEEVKKVRKTPVRSKAKK